MNPPADALTSSGLNFYEWMVDGNGKRVALFDRGDHSGLGTTNRQQTAPQVIPETLTPDGTVKIRQRLTLPASEA